MKFLIVIILIFITPNTSITFAQKVDTITGSKVNNPGTQIQNLPRKSVIPPDRKAALFHTNDEKSLTIGLMVFSGFVLILSTLLLYKFSTDCNIAFKYFVIVLLILGMLIMLAVGFDEKTISPAIGLFGTIAGYLLGRVETPKTRPSEDVK